MSKVVVGAFAPDPLDAAASALVQAMDETNPTMRWARARAAIGVVTQQICRELIEATRSEIKSELRELLAPVLSEIEKR
jgi:hypothetical protein